MQGFNGVRKIFCLLQRSLGRKVRADSALALQRTPGGTDGRKGEGRSHSTVPSVLARSYNSPGTASRPSPPPVWVSSGRERKEQRKGVFPSCWVMPSSGDQADRHADMRTPRRRLVCLGAGVGGATELLVRGR